ncbi:OprD family outer membrane porin [Aestuariivirga sp.]|uniref:OprD family outer membrane porin n=1 Tax=Aestuariivirga sp. TaxID=2650926 RepID=UPI003BA8AE80
MRGGRVVASLILAAVVIWQNMPAQAADTAPAQSGDLLRALFDDATFTLHPRSYLFDDNEASGGGPAALALGGWLGYQTGWIGDVLQLGITGYTSQPLWAPQDRDGTLLLMPGQKGFSVLGQAYAALRYEDQQLTLYRQLVELPEVNKQDDRMVPNTFEGGTLKGELGPFSYFGGVLTAMKTRDADHFVNIADAAGVEQNEIMYLGELAVSQDEDVRARTSLYVVPNLLASSYSDAELELSLATELRARLSGQFMFQTGIGDEMMTGPGFQTWILGVMGDIQYRGLTLTAGYAANGEDDDWQSPYGSWPGYTNMVVRDFDRAEEQTLLLGAAFDFGAIGIDGLALAARTALDLDVAPGLASYNEYDLLADYRLQSLSGNWAWLSPFRLRAQYAWVEEDDTNGTRSLSNELRVILDYDFKFEGSDL